MRKPIIVLLAITAVITLALMYVSVQSWTAPGQRPGFSLIRGFHEASRTMDKDLSIQPGQTVTITSAVGTVTITGGKPQGQLTAEVTAYGLTRKQATEIADLTTIDVEESPQGLHIKTNVPRSIRQRTNTVNLTIELPADVNVVVRSSMGKVSVIDHTGRLDIDTAMGSVHVNRFHGDLIATSRMGELNISHSTIDQLLDLSSNMGSIKFAGTLGSDNRVTTNMGSITLTLPDTTCVDLTADVNMGSIDVSFPFQGKTSERRYSGQLGTGQPTGKLYIDSSMGSIEIKGGYH